jgi:hypothetical protein
MLNLLSGINRAIKRRWLITSAKKGASHEYLQDFRVEMVAGRRF